MVNLRTVELDELVEEVFPLVADHGVHIEIVCMARLTVV